MVSQTALKSQLRSRLGGSFSVWQQSQSWFWLMELAWCAPSKNHGLGSQFAWREAGSRPPASWSARSNYRKPSLLPRAANQTIRALLLLTMQAVLRHRYPLWFERVGDNTQMMTKISLTSVVAIACFVALL